MRVATLVLLMLALFLVAGCARTGPPACRLYDPCTCPGACCMPGDPCDPCAGSPDVLETAPR